MSLTPLLGEVADWLCEKGGADGDAATTEARRRDEILALFERVDADGSGSIDLDELRVFVAKAGLPAAKADRAFAEIDADGDGNLTLAEWRAGLETSAVRDLLARDDDLSNDAVLVCGYGLLGKAVLDALEAADVACVAIDLDPGRVAAGVLDGRNVIYGDGANAEVLAAAGVSAPKAVVVIPEPGCGNSARR